MDTKTKKLLLGLVILILLIALVFFIIHGKNTIDNFYFAESDDTNINSQIDQLNNILNEINNTNIPTPSLTLSNDTNLRDEILKTYGDTTNNLNNLKLTNNTTNNNTRLSNLNDEITDLERKINNYTNPDNKKQFFNVIKSHNNGQEFCLYYDDKSKIIDPKTNTEKTGYLININNGCLSVGAEDYGVYKCNSSNPKQYFKIVNVYNDEMYKQNIDQTVPYLNANSLKVERPFSLLKSVNNDNCLTNNHGYLTVQPCSNLVSQRWTPM